MPGLINLDFADVKTIMSGMGLAMMGTGIAEGQDRAMEAARRAISSPLLEGSSVNGSREWLPWAIYIALACVALSFLLLLYRLLRSAAALARANAELGTSNARLQSTNELLRRAAELSRSNAELEQFASIASHDLQEPLRKVQTFAAQLTANESEHLSEQEQDSLRRMSDAAGRMRALIDDLLAFSRVSTQGHPFTAVNLGIPKNTEVPFYTENAPDSFGYVANPAGPSYTDQGVGAILATSTNPRDDAIVALSTPARTMAPRRLHSKNNQSNSVMAIPSPMRNRR